MCFWEGERERGIISLGNNTLNGKKRGAGGGRGQEEKGGEGRHEVKQR